VRDRSIEVIPAFQHHFFPCKGVSSELDFSDVHSLFQVPELLSLDFVQIKCTINPN
jgi:hypothetical protein